MKILKTFLLLSLLSMAALAEIPKVGDQAPPFSLPSANGSNVALKDFIGKSNVVIVFYRGYW